jgi:paraquat-inducible protein A
MSSFQHHTLTCGLCGQPHTGVALAAGETARCVRCDGLLASAPRGGRHTPAALAWAGLALAVPAGLLPFITVEKLGNLRTGDFLGSVSGLADRGMPVLALWVLVCGGLAPLLLLGALLMGHRHPEETRRMGHALAHWAMPEVFVLAVFVSLTRLGSIVSAEINAGFVCYAAMALALLLAWRAFRLQPQPAPA